MTKTRTEPLLARRIESDTLPDVAEVETDPIRIVSMHVEATSPGLDDSTTDPGPPPEGAPASESARVDDVLKNMKGARVWSPPAASSAESKGADFAAYHALAAAAKRHETPAVAERVVVDITIPSPPPANDEAAHPPVAELAALIQESRARGAGARDAGADAHAVTEVRRPPRKRALTIFAVTLVVVVTVGGVAVWGNRGHAAGAPTDTDKRATAASTVVSTNASSRAASPPSSAVAEGPSATSAIVAPFSAPSHSAASAHVVPDASGARPLPMTPPAPPRTSAVKPASPPAKTAPTPPLPIVTEPKPDLPKNDLPRSL
jgi:hypothetical protein